MRIGEWGQLSKYFLTAFAHNFYSEGNEHILYVFSDISSSGPRQMVQSLKGLPHKCDDVNSNL